jgi:hypothetical protein
MYFVSQPIVTNGLILNLDAGNTLSYTSGSSTWRDLAGSNSSGSFVNNPIYQSTNGSSFTFNGTNQYVNITGDITTALSGSSQASLQMVFDYPSLGTGADSTVGGFQATNFEFFFYPNTYVGARLYANIQGISSAIEIAVSATSFIGRKVHAVLTIDPSTIRVYVNGILRGSASNTAGQFASSSNFRLASIPRLGTNFAGNIYTTSVYNRALSAAEVQQNFNALRGRYGI